jgi:hypothetical protein
MNQKSFLREVLHFVSRVLTANMLYYSHGNVLTACEISVVPSIAPLIRPTLRTGLHSDFNIGVSARTEAEHRTDNCQ